MEGCPVAFVTRKAVVRVQGIPSLHSSIAPDLREDACCGDAEAQTIASDEGGLRFWKGVDREAVDEGVVRFRVKFRDGAPHAFVGCAEDVELVNFLRGDLDDGVGDVLT